MSVFKYSYGNIADIKVYTATQQRNSYMSIVEEAAQTCLAHK